MKEETGCSSMQMRQVKWVGGGDGGARGRFRFRVLHGSARARRLGFLTLGWSPSGAEEDDGAGGGFGVVVLERRTRDGLVDAAVVRTSGRV